MDINNWWISNFINQTHIHMKNLKMILPLLFLAAIAFNANTQDWRAALVSFMKVEPGGEGDYVQLEREVWKPIHAELIKAGKLDSWSLWAIPYPGGTDAEYHYATVNIYNSMDQLEDPGAGIGEAFGKAHPGKEWADIGAMTLKSRDLVKTHGLGSWERFGDPNMTGPAGIINVVYFDVPMDKWDAYQEMERKYFHPTHKAEVEAGTRAGWEGWQLMRPMGESMPYDFVAVDQYRDWKQYTKNNPEDLFEGVLSERELNHREDIFNSTAKLVKLEEWRLIDFVSRQSIEAGN